MVVCDVPRGGETAEIDRKAVENLCVWRILESGLLLFTRGLTPCETTVCINFAKLRIPNF